MTTRVASAAKKQPSRAGAFASQSMTSYGVTLHIEGRDHDFVVLAADIARASAIAERRLRERSTEGRVVAVRFLGQALVGGEA